MFITVKINKLGLWSVEIYPASRGVSLVCSQLVCYITRLISEGNDFVNAKTHAREKLLLADYSPRLLTTPNSFFFLVLDEKHYLFIFFFFCTPLFLFSFNVRKHFII